MERIIDKNIDKTGMYLKNVFNDVMSEAKATKPKVYGTTG